MDEFPATQSLDDEEFPATQQMSSGAEKRESAKVKILFVILFFELLVLLLQYTIVVFFSRFFL